MLTYSLRRLLVNIPVLIVFSFVMYLVLYQAADPKARLRQIPGIRAEDLQRIAKQQHLDDPWYTGYWHWLKDFVRGDWGTSLSNQANSAADQIFSHMPATLELLLGSLIVATLLAAPLGVFSAVRRYSGFDYSATAFAYLGYAMPTFLLGLLLQLFAIWMKDHGWAVIPLTLGIILVLASGVGVIRWLFAQRSERSRLAARSRRPSRGTWITVGAGCVLALVSVVFWSSFGGHGNLVFYTAQRFSVGHDGDIFSTDHLRHLILPLVTLTTIQIAGWSRYQRAATLDVLNADYLRTARAKGLSERKVVGRHALRNALLPLITIMAIDLGAIFSGAVITETIFAWPGIGTLFYRAALNRDIPVAMGVLMFGALMIVIFNLIADIAYAIADPRIRLS